MRDKLEIQEYPLWAKLAEKRFPLSFDLDVTARCNNDCRHCYINVAAGDRAAQAQELTVAEISDLADQAVRLGSIWCLLSGGEPLLRPDFPDLYFALKRRGFLVSVFTNATLVSAEHVALFRKYPPRDIEVTVYGVTRETYEAVTRTPGSFERFMRGLDLLLAAGIRVRLKTVAIRSNLAEQAAIADFCRARTGDYFRFDPQLHLRYDGNPDRNSEIFSERLTPQEIVALENADVSRIATLRQNCHTLIADEDQVESCDHLFRCGTGNGSFSVSYDGRFRLCSSLGAQGTTYDLRRGTLAQAWNEYVPQVRGRKWPQDRDLPACRSCELANLCLWCPAHAYLETGALDGSTPYFCAVAHARAANLRTEKAES